VFDLKQICLYKNFFQNGLYDLKAVPNYEYEWKDVFINLFYSRGKSNVYAYYPEIYLKKNESASKVYASFELGVADDFKSLDPEF
jgi:hypothetical protein